MWVNLKENGKEPIYERASDAKAAIDFLKTQGRIDSTRIELLVIAKVFGFQLWVIVTEMTLS